MAIYLKGSKVVPKGPNGNQIVSVPSKYWDIPYLRTTLTFNNKVVSSSIILHMIKKPEYEVMNVKWSDGMVFNYPIEEIRYSRSLTLIGTYVAKIADTLSTLKVFANNTLVSIDHIADGLTTLASEAFKDSTALKTGTIPETVTTIESDVFSGCTSLQSLYFTGRNESDITSMSNYDNWITNIPDSLVVLIYWKKGSDTGCFVYKQPDAVLLTDENTDAINSIVTETNDFINKD